METEVEIEDYWWENETTFCFKSKDGKIWKCENCYPTSIKFNELEYCNTEDCSIQMTTTRYTTVHHENL